MKFHFHLRSIMTKLIAEIGFNYIDDAGLCKEMVQAAKDSGAEFAKFQYFDPKYLKPGPWDTDGRREIYERLQWQMVIQQV